MGKEHIVRYIGALPDGTHVVEHPDGRLERRKSETDWDRVRRMTDQEIETAIADDPDWAEVKDIDWSKADIRDPFKKRAISIRVDEDVLAFFKREGAGYQRRINAVLRSYVEQKKSTKKRA